MTRAEKAKNYFNEGYNCCQAVVLAFCDKVDIDKNIRVRNRAHMQTGTVYERGQILRGIDKTIFGAHDFKLIVNCV